MNYRKIALIGMMGSGKSAVSKALAQKLNLKRFEADEIFEQKHSIKIKDFFKNFGEPLFREEETKILKELLRSDDFVLSCGGGVVLSPVNQKLLFNNEILTIYLQASSDTIYDRIKADKTRPLLLVDNPKEEIEKILLKRVDLYKKAHITITTDNKTINEIVEEIINYGKDSNFIK